MQALGGTRAHSRMEAELEELTRVLRSFGVLTYANLKELSGARRWTGPHFDYVLHVAIREGRIRKLGDELYELIDTHAH
ncbi:MAG TPA: hypothetical protein VJU60_04510 [Thermoleophilaceae bacterium]|nr:hypothetical protein [Thermoleophilaceae bacterium]